METDWRLMTEFCTNRRRAVESRVADRNADLTERIHETRQVEALTNRAERAEQARELKKRQEAAAAGVSS